MTTEPTEASVINSRLQNGDIIIMKDPDSKQPSPPHAGVAYKTDEFNNIGVLITGIKGTDAAIHLSKKEWVADIFRYSPSYKDRNEVLNIRRLIGEQAFKWYNIGQNERESRNYKKLLLPLLLIIIFASILIYRFGRIAVVIFMFLFNFCVIIQYHIWSNKERKIHYNFAAFYEDLFCEKNKIDPDSLYDHDEDLNTLNYIKYSLRKYVSVSLERGITCYGFAMNCIASALLDDLLSPYHVSKGDTLWPSLKYSNECCKKHAPSIYQKSAKMIKNQAKEIKYDRDKFVTLLIEKYVKDENLNEKTIQKWQRYVPKQGGVYWYGILVLIGVFVAIFAKYLYYLFAQTDVIIIMFLSALCAMITYYINKKKKIPISCYFAGCYFTDYDEKVDDEKVFYEKAKQKLGALILMHPKYSNINHLVTYLNEENGVWQKIATNVK